MQSIGMECKILPPLFVKEFPRFGRNISAKIGSSQLISANQIISSKIG